MTVKIQSYQPDDYREASWSRGDELEIVLDKYCDVVYIQYHDSYGNLRKIGFDPKELTKTINFLIGD